MKAPIMTIKETAAFYGVSESAIINQYKENLSQLRKMYEQSLTVKPGKKYRGYYPYQLKELVEKFEKILS